MNMVNYMYWRLNSFLFKPKHEVETCMKEFSLFHSVESCVHIIQLLEKEVVYDDIDATGELNYSVECRIYFLKLLHFYRTLQNILMK